jgi:hypothetical protein
VEFEPIRNWLEIEVGTAALFGNARTEWDRDILFKKPFTLSDKVEFMVGAGPQWSQPVNGAGKLGAEFALDFMFWPAPDRKLGWFVEPNYSYSFGSDHEQSLGVSSDCSFLSARNKSKGPGGDSADPSVRKGEYPTWRSILGCQVKEAANSGAYFASDARCSSGSA